MTGVFRPAGTTFATPGVLSWSAERGAELELVDRSDPWPSSFDETFTVHGQPHDGEAVTLLDAHVRQTTIVNVTSQVSSWALALGEHVDSDEPWPVANYRPAGLHEWLPETGLSIDRRTKDGSHVMVEWRPPEARTVQLPEGQVIIQPGSDYAWSYSPKWSIETTMTFTVKPDRPLTINEHREQYGHPLLSFVVFAADHPDNITRESYYDPERRIGVVVLRPTREFPKREWRPNPGHFLFKAADVPDISAAIAKWFEVWRKTVPSLGLFREVIGIRAFIRRAAFPDALHRR